jgi:multidrug resistance efflux pump
MGIAVALLLVRCGEQPGAANAAATPQLELKGAVAQVKTGAASAAIDGRVATLNTPEGASIRAGDVVATLTNSSIERDLAHVRAEIAVAERRLKEARKPIAMSLVLGDAGARERAAAEILKNREAKRDRYRELFKTHDISRQELEDAENEYAAAMQNWLAERERQTTKIVATDTSVLELELARARADEKFVLERKELLIVKAPMGGVVTRVLVRPGDNVYTRDPLVEIADTSTVDVHVAIAPELLRHVRVGMPVEVKILTVPPRRFTQPVRSITRGGGPTGAILVVQVPNPDGVLQAGQNAMVTVR